MHLVYCIGKKHFYPRPPRGGRRYNYLNKSSRPLISIHALREEGDTASPSARMTLRISIHALREEGDFLRRAEQTCNNSFLSTPSARRATLSGQNAPIMQGLFLSTPSARRATSLRLFIVSSLPTFLSTPSARRATGLPLKLLTLDFNFYPRPPRGGRHLRPLECSWVPPISIHALREEGDTPPWMRCPTTRYFYPRPPRGGRP